VREDVIARLKASAHDPATVEMLDKHTKSYASKHANDFPFDDAARARIVDAVEEAAGQAYADARQNGLSADKIERAVKAKAEERAEAAASEEAKLLAESTTQHSLANGKAFAPLDAAAQAQLAAYGNNGPVGATGRRLAVELNGLTKAEFDAKMAAEFPAGPVQTVGSSQILVVKTGGLNG
jgi:hypothetical protein